MNVDFGSAVGGVAIGISVLDDYMQELHRIQRIPHSIPLQRTIGGADFDLTILLDPPRFEMAKPSGTQPFTQLVLAGTVEVRPAGQPNAPPEIHPLDAAVRLSLVEVLVAEIGLRYEGVERPPSDPLTAADIDEIFNNPLVSSLLDSIRLTAGKQLIEGLRAAMPGGGIPAEDWGFTITLMPAGTDTVDSFAATVALLGNPAPALRESFLPQNQGLAVGFNRSFLDLILSLGADEKKGTTVEGAKINELDLHMTDGAIQVDGDAVKPVWFVLPDVNISFAGPMIPSLVRGTTMITFDMSGVKVDIDDSDEAFYTVMKWFTTLFAGALLFTGNIWLAGASIILWTTVVQFAWNGSVEIGNAPNVLRESLSAALGAELSLLAQNLDDDTTIGQITIDSTPDSLLVVLGNFIFTAQVLVVPITARLASAEYSKKLKRFVIFELEDGRRFRAQELARLMALGKVSVPGFHQVNRNYIRANPDDVEANNLLRTFKANPTTEVVLPTKR